MPDPVEEAKTLQLQGRGRCRAYLSGSRPTAAMRGSVTAELAVVLPAVTVLLAMLLLSVAAGMLQLRLEEGARAGARALARGDSSAQVLELVMGVAGDSAIVSLGSSGGYATVTVQGKVGGVLSGLVPWVQSAHASARVESTDAPSSARRVMAALALRQKFVVLKPALWRWARAPECKLADGQCTATASNRPGVPHGQG